MTSSFGAASRIPMKPVTYWAPIGLGSDNEVTYANPVLIMGRWIEERTQIQNAQGEQTVSNTVVIVDRDLEEGGYLAQGSHLSETSPTAFNEAQEIQGFTSTPDLRFMEQVRRAYL